MLVKTPDIGGEGSEDQRGKRYMVLMKTRNIGGDWSEDQPWLEDARSIPQEPILNPPRQLNEHPRFLHSMASVREPARIRARALVQSAALARLCPHEG